MRTDLQKIIKFIFLAIPGVFLFLFATIYLIGWHLESQARTILPNPLLTMTLHLLALDWFGFTIQKRKKTQSKNLEAVWL